jgi:hypothetical protein
MIWQANISRGGIDVYQPSFRSAVKARAWDIAMSAVGSAIKERSCSAHTQST